MLTWARSQRRTERRIQMQATPHTFGVGCRSDERAEFLINDRLSFMRFLGLGLEDRVPDARTIWLVPGEADHGRGDKEIVRAVRCHAEAGWLHRHVGSDRRCQPGCGAVSAQYGRREEGDQRGPDTGELESQAGQAAAQRSRRWTVKFTKAKPRQDGSMPPVDLAIPLFGYQNHVSIDRRFGFIRRWAATDAATYEGRRLRQGLLDKSNTASGVWADTAYRSAANETFLNKNDFVSHIHRKKPKGRAMHETTRRANNAKIENPLACRACVRRAKGSGGALYQNYRDRPSNDQDRNGQSRLQHQTFYLPAQDRHRMTGLCYARRPIRLITQSRSG